MIITIRRKSSSSTKWTPRQARGLLAAMAVKEAERSLEKERRGSDCSAGLTSMKGRGEKGGGVSDCSTRLLKLPPS